MHLPTRHHVCMKEEMGKSKKLKTNTEHTAQHASRHAPHVRLHAHSCTKPETDTLENCRRQVDVALLLFSSIQMGFAACAACPTRGELGSAPTLAGARGLSISFTIKATNLNFKSKDEGEWEKQEQALSQNGHRLKIPLSFPDPLPCMQTLVICHIKHECTYRRDITFA